MDTVKVSEYNRKYYQAHREQIALRRLNARHMGKEGFAPLTHEMWDKIKSDQSGKCKRCQEIKPLTPFVTKGTKYLGLFIGLCALCGSREALELARAARQRARDQLAEKKAEQFTGVQP